jgi:hypothetical protein
LLHSTSWRIRRRLLILSVSTVLVGAMLSTVLPGRPASAGSASAPANVVAVCQQATSVVAADFTENLHAQALASTASATDAQSAIRQIDARRSTSAAGCVQSLRAEGAVWSYTSAKLTEYAINAVITIFGATLICAYTAAAGCAWGFRLSAFIGGFVGSMVNQYLRGGGFNAQTAKGAYVAALANMLIAYGVSGIQKEYLLQGVKATMLNIGQALRPVVARVSGIGNIVSAVEQEMTAIAGTSIFAGVDATARARFEPAVVPPRNEAFTAGVQFRAPYAVNYPSDVHDDLWSGSFNTPYYNWTVSRLPATNQDGAQGYLIRQGGQCLSDTGYYVKLLPCSYHDSSQWWFMDGDQLMSSAGNCLDEWAYANFRVVNTCTVLTAPVNVSADDDDFIPTDGAGAYIPDSVGDWATNWRSYTR